MQRLQRENTWILSGRIAGRDGSLDLKCVRNATRWCNLLSPSSRISLLIGRSSSRWSCNSCPSSNCQCWHNPAEPRHQALQTPDRSLHGPQTPDISTEDTTASVHEILQTAGDVIDDAVSVNISEPNSAHGTQSTDQPSRGNKTTSTISFVSGFSWSLACARVVIAVSTTSSSFSCRLLMLARQ